MINFPKPLIDISVDSPLDFPGTEENNKPNDIIRQMTNDYLRNHVEADVIITNRSELRSMLFKFGNNINQDNITNSIKDDLRNNSSILITCLITLITTEFKDLEFFSFKLISKESLSFIFVLITVLIFSNCARLLVIKLRKDSGDMNSIRMEKHINSAIKKIQKNTKKKGKYK